MHSHETNNKTGKTIIMSAKTATKTPAVMPKVPMMRHPAGDYPRLQSCRRLAGVPKLKTRQGQTPDGVDNYWITYQMNGKSYEAPSLDVWSTVLAEAIAGKIDLWTPDTSVVTLTELLAACRFCDPSIEVDIHNLKSARIPEKLKSIVVIADSQGFGLDKDGHIVQIAELLAAINAGEALGMKFVTG